MKLRLCSIVFKENMRIQVGNNVKTMSPGKSLDLVELGNIESFGTDHLVGVVSQDIVDTKRVKNNISDLEEMTTGERIKWFEKNYPRAKMIKIESNRILDQLRKDKVIEKPAAIINSAADLKWSK